MLRSFIAVELTADLRSAISRLQMQVRDELSRELRKIAPDARLQWVKPESVHLTLKFLGDIREEQVPGVRNALTASVAQQQTFMLEVRGVGVFPDLRSPRILWVGLNQGSVSPSSEMLRLAKMVDGAMTAVGFPPESKSFTPHLTLARIKDRNREIGNALATIGVVNSGSAIGTLSVREVSLMKSDLQKSGAVYTRLFAIPLHGAG